MRALVALLLAACAYERPARFDPTPDAPTGPSCVIDNGGCDVNATCTLNGATPQCTCKSDYFGDGKRCTKTWELVHTVPNLQLEFGWGFVVAVIDTKIYFAPEFEQAGVYFKSIDVETGAVADLQMPPLYNNVQNEFCACGGNETLVTRGTSIYAFGNDASIYETTNNTWTQMPAFTSQRSDAAGVEVRGRAYLLGGSPNGMAAEYYANAGPTTVASLPFSASLPGASAIGDTIYVFGGGTSRNEVASLDTTSDTNTWVPLATAPIDLSSSPTIGVFGTTLVVTYGVAGKLHTYQPTSNSWPGTSIDLPAGDAWKLVTVGQSVYAFGQRTESGIRSVVLYRLLAIP